MKIFLIAGICLSFGACDPATNGGITVTPQPERSADSTRQIARAIAARVAAQSGLQPWAPGSGPADSTDHQCFVSGTLTLCSVPVRGGMAFRILQLHKFHFDTRAKALRNALLDSLRNRFGESSVRLCDWNAEGDSCGGRS